MEVVDEADWKRFDSAGRLFWNMNTVAISTKPNGFWRHSAREGNFCQRATKAR